MLKYNCSVYNNFIKQSQHQSQTSFDARFSYNLFSVITWAHQSSFQYSFSVVSGNASLVATNSLKQFFSYKMVLSPLTMMTTFLAIVVWTRICLLTEFVELVLMVLPLCNVTLFCCSFEYSFLVLYIQYFDYYVT